MKIGLHLPKSSALFSRHTVHGNSITELAVILSVENAPPAQCVIIGHHYDTYRVGQKAAHFQSTITMQPLNLGRNGFHRNVLRVFETKESNEVLYSC